jgi:hypothetical protein
MFKRHKTSTIFLVIYYLWWCFLVNFFISGSSAYPNSCGAANGGLIIYTLFIVIIYTLILLIFIIRFSKQARKDYLLFLGLTLAPILILWTYMQIG